MTTITYINKDGKSISIEASKGMTLMEVAVANDIPIEAICGGSLACATCHLIIEEGFEKTYPPSQDEIDMLSFADNVCDKSRLSCQIEVSDDIEGIVIKLP